MKPLPFVSTILPMNEALGSNVFWLVGFASHPGITGFEHTPVAGSHVPALWHASSAVHVTAGPDAHAPV